MKIKNTKKKGFYEFFVFPKKRGHYVGICLTLNIVDEGEDPQKIMKDIISAAIGHIKIVINKNLSDELLNRPAPKEYWNRYEEFIRQGQETEKGKRLWEGAIASQRDLSNLVVV